MYEHVKFFQLSSQMLEPPASGGIISLILYNFQSKYSAIKKLNCKLVNSICQYF